MKKLKVMTVVGTRPEIIRLSCLLKKFESNESIDHVLVHTGQNYDYNLNEIFFLDLNIRKPDFYLNAAGNSGIETVGQILIKIDTILEQIRPDAFVVLGDTNSCLSAIAAKKRQIPIFHIEAGNRCYDQRVPEESNRKIVDHIADINLTYSDIAKEHLINEGIRPDFVFKIGSPMLEVLESQKSKIENSTILNTLSLTTNNYFVVSAHREENIAVEEKFLKFIDIIRQIDERYCIPIIVSTHPRTRKMLEKYDIHFSKNVSLLNPFCFSDYLSLQINAKAVLSDSGTISEESSILNLRALNIRETHERQEAMEEGSVMMVGLNIDRIMQGLSILNCQNHKEKRDLRIVTDYNVDNVSEKIVRIIISYVDYINRIVWRKVI